MFYMFGSVAYDNTLNKRTWWWWWSQFWF